MPPKPSKPAVTDSVVEIPPPNMLTTTLRIHGTAPYVQEAFSRRVREHLLEGMSTPKSEKKTKAQRPIRNYQQEFEEAQHKTANDWVGIPCGALRNAMIAACRTVGMVMTTAKMAIFIRPDGFDAIDGTPVVRLHATRKPEEVRLPVRNASGVVDMRVRPMWREWWADVMIEFDADLISAKSVVHLLDRAGRQVGIGAGRPFSKNSAGMGWGTFMVQITSQPVESPRVAEEVQA